MDTVTKVRENRLRRLSERRRMRLVRSRRRDTGAWDYGRYWLVPDRGKVIGGRAAGEPPGLTLDEVEDWLTR